MTATQSFADWVTLYLATKLTPGWVLTVTADPWVTNWRLYYKNNNQVEWLQFTSVTASWSYFVLGWLTRDIDPTAIPITSNSTWKTWLATQSCVLVAMHDQLWNTQQWWPFASFTTVQLTARPNKIVWETFYDSTLWSLVYWNGSAYQTFWTWIFVNATTTSSWWVEIATPTESKNWTDNWSVWPLVVAPSDIAKNTQSWTFEYWEDSWWDDTYVVALTPVLTEYTTWQKISFKVTTANTWACSVDFWPGVKSIKDRDGNNPVNWQLYGTVTVQYDGTNFVLETAPTLSTDAEVIDGTVINKSITPKQAKDNYWTNYSTWTSDTIFNHSSVNTTTATSFTKLKEFVFNKRFLSNLVFTLSHEKPLWFWSWVAHWRIYVNWIAVWTDQTTSTPISSWGQTFSQQIQLAAWDLVQLYAYTTDAASSQNTTVRNFTVLWTLTYSNNIPPVINL